MQGIRHGSLSRRFQYIRERYLHNSKTYTQQQSHKLSKQKLKPLQRIVFTSMTFDASYIPHPGRKPQFRNLSTLPSPLLILIRILQSAVNSRVNQTRTTCWLLYSLARQSVVHRPCAGSRHELFKVAYNSVVTTSALSTIQPNHANASIAVSTRHAWNCEQNAGKFGQIFFYFSPNKTKTKNGAS